jgi:hypothetical protein
MSLSVQRITDLTCGPVYLFANWSNPKVPTFGAGVYTIWHNDGRFIYVGMSGRGITAETSRRDTPQGIYLQSHASGRRTGDQFCVYVADRPVLPTLSLDDITAIASGRPRWMHSRADISMSIFAIGSLCCRMERQLTQLKPRSRWASLRMAVLFSIPEAERGILLRASPRL